jgi:hypothetical protein
MKLWIIAGALLASLSPNLAQAQVAPGEWALGKYKGGNFYYTGQVVRIAGNVVTIKYESGFVENLYRAQVKEYDWDTGTQIQCKGTDGKWYTGSIVKISDDDRIDVMYGRTRQWAVSKNCRSW